MNQPIIIQRAAIASWLARRYANPKVRIRFIWVMYSWAGLWVVGAQWRFGIFAVGLQMAIKLNQVKLNIYHTEP